MSDRLRSAHLNPSTVRKYSKLIGPSAPPPPEAADAIDGVDDCDGDDDELLGGLPVPLEAGGAVDGGGDCEGGACEGSGDDCDGGGCEGGDDCDGGGCEGGGDDCDGGGCEGGGCEGGGDELLGAVPVPLNATVCVPTPALVLMLSTALDMPTDAGSNTTFTVHFAPTARDVPQLLVWL